MQIASIFFDTHMGLAFNGLGEILRKNKIDPRDKMVVFLNSKKTKFKLLINDKYLVYHDNKNTMIDLNSIRHLPKAFEGSSFDFSRAVEGAIREKFTDQGKKR